MDIQEKYSNLLKKYEMLNDEEKKAITIYSSSLFYNINEISSIDNFENMTSIEILNELTDKEEFIKRMKNYKKYIDDPSNIFLKYLVFGKIDFNNIENFTTQMKDVYRTINQAKEKILLDEDLTVYRSCSYTEKEYNISKGNLISTTLDPEVTKQFMFTNGKNNKLYVIKLKKGTPVLVNPLSIKNVYDSEASYIMNQSPKKVKVTNDISQSQLEIILFKDTLELTTDKKVTHEEYNLEVETIDTNLKRNKDIIEVSKHKL